MPSLPRILTNIVNLYHVTQAFALFHHPPAHVMLAQFLVVSLILATVQPHTHPILAAPTATHYHSFVHTHAHPTLHTSHLTPHSSSAVCCCFHRSVCFFTFSVMPHATSHHHVTYEYRTVSHTSSYRPLSSRCLLLPPPPPPLHCVCCVP